ncbi:MAG: helix-turn-helix transcriptional regulator [Actinobacteria bacterium]|nr:helix-turn-helix transcriptional regulator [Actinomycetota bacterium]
MPATTSRPTLPHVTRRHGESRAIERVTDICAQHHDSRSLRLALLDELRNLIGGFDAYAWLLTDPVTEVGGSPLADVPWLEALPRQIHLKYLTPLNRWTGLTEPPVACLRAVTGGRLDQSLVWRELLVDYGVRDAASVVFRDRFGCWAFLELWRTGSSFTDAEAEVLVALNSTVTSAIRRCQARTFELDAPVSERTGPVVLILSPQLAVRAQTPETEQFLKLLVPPESDRRPIPAGAYNVGAQLLAVEAGVDTHPPTARVHLSGGLWLTLRAARIGGTEPSQDQDIAVTIERTDPRDRLDLFTRSSGLTVREAELLGHLAAGADTREVARRMFLSEHTVQDHLKGIFAKSGAPNRRTLLARATGR